MRAEISGVSKVTRYNVNIRKLIRFYNIVERNQTTNKWRDVP